MSQTKPSSISPQLAEYLTQLGRSQLPHDASQYMPSVLAQKIFDGHRKSKHPIYPVWRKLQHPCHGDTVSETFKHFGYFWEWYKEQVVNIPSHLEKTFKVVRINSERPYEPSNCKLVELKEAYNYYDLENHLPASSYRDFYHMVEKGLSAKHIGNFFGWTGPTSSRILKRHNDKIKAEKLAKENAPKEKTMIALMRE